MGLHPHLQAERVDGARPSSAGRPLPPVHLLFLFNLDVLALLTSFSLSDPNYTTTIV
jgi:hypothetical protein